MALDLIGREMFPAPKWMNKAQPLNPYKLISILLTASPLLGNRTSAVTLDGAYSSAAHELLSKKVPLKIHPINLFMNFLIVGAL